jgi:hypothetical protein
MEGINNSSISRSGYPVQQDIQSKTLTRGIKADALGGGGPSQGSDPALVQWYQQAYAYYNAVVSHDPSTPQPDQATWQNFLSQMQWAAGQLGYGQQQWDPSMGQGGGMPGAGGMPGMGGPQGQQVPAGATLGTQNNVVYNSPTANINAEGDTRVQDIWSNDVNINIPSLSSSVTSEITTDPRFQPGEQVLKIISHDPATGVDTVYIVHDYADAKIKINTPVKTQFTDSSSFSGISWNQYQDPTTASANAHPDASIPGTPDPSDPNTITYEPDYAGTTVDFFANPGPNQTAIVYADSNITVKPSDQVKVDKGTGADAGTVVVTVTHKDGSTDTYKIQKGYKVNINVNENYVTLEGQPGTSGVPSDLSNLVTLNGGTTSGGTTSSGGVDPQSIISSLESSTGRSDAQLISALKAAGYTNINSLDDLKKAITAGTFPGTPPSKQLLGFLVTVDPQLNSDVQTLNSKIGGSDDGAKKSARDAVGSRLLTLLEGLYPNDILNNATTGDQTVGGKISFDGTKYTWDIWNTADPTLTFD